MQIQVTVHQPICKVNGDLNLALYGSFLPVPSVEIFSSASVNVVPLVSIVSNLTRSSKRLTACPGCHLTSPQQIVGLFLTLHKHPFVLLDWESYLYCESWVSCLRTHLMGLFRGEGWTRGLCPPFFGLMDQWPFEWCCAIRVLSSKDLHVLWVSGDVALARIFWLSLFEFSGSVRLHSDFQCTNH